MSGENDAFEMDEPQSEWQFGAWPEGTVKTGGGLLQTILDEVTAIREGAAADRVALAKAVSASFSKVDAELSDVRGQLTTVRSDLDDLRAAIAATATVDVRPQVQEAVGDMAAALEKQLDALREAIPTAHMARVAAEVQQLRNLLIGPD
jgi:outer membrane translocation and assembly module TamA